MKWLLVMVIVACNAAGDLLDAAGMKREGEGRDFRPRGIVKLIMKIVRNRYVIGGIGMMAIAFIAQLSLLSITELSFALPASASSYFVETVLAKIVLGEQVNRTRWIGAGLVAIGVALLQF